MKQNYHETSAEQTVKQIGGKLDELSFAFPVQCQALYFDFLREAAMHLVDTEYCHTFLTIEIIVHQNLLEIQLQRPHMPHQLDREDEIDQIQPFLAAAGAADVVVVLVMPKHTSKVHHLQLKKLCFL